MRSLCKAANPCGELQGAKNMVNRKNKVLKLCLFFLSREIKVSIQIF
jgi:hypothetical protein